jgi:hypothetical protein
MSKQEKALRRLASKPTDFTWRELVSLMSSLEIVLIHGSGSARKFRNPASGEPFAIHQPHPSNILKPYQVRDAIEFLKQEGFLK